MNNNQTLEEVSVNDLLKSYNLIVPEIQREYVWGHNYNNILGSFFKDIKEGVRDEGTGSETMTKAIGILNSSMENADENVRNMISAVVKKMHVENNEMNIGFLYSYRPDYFVFNDRSEDIYLIDGQQRFTTLVLMLFYFSIKEERTDDYLNLFRFDQKSERIAFDYRVRTLTHSFFVDLISQTKKLEDISDIQKKNWFLSNYGDDPTIKAVVFGLFPKMHEAFADDDNFYYDFLKHKVKFWHFRTEETSQGEELYITMNSRGQQLADNENLRAALFEPESIGSAGKNALYWSGRWEIWQDFFWKKRKKDQNSNADAGFNEFLRWVQICRMTEKERLIIDDEDEESLDKRDIIKIIKWEKDPQLDIAFLSLPEIDSYFNALEYLYEVFPLAIKEFKSKFSTYSNFDLLDLKWLSPAEATIPQIDLFRLLPVLYYVKRILTTNNDPDPATLFRLLRFFYNMRHNETITKTAGLQTINSLKLMGRLRHGDDLTVLLRFKSNAASILNTEERVKLSILSDHPQRQEVEDRFWFAEDMHYNRGQIGFLIDWSKTNNNGEFSIRIFGKMLASYVYIVSEESAIRGELLLTAAFDTYWDRVTWHHEFYKNEEFLGFVLAWHKSKQTALSDFLMIRRKNFIKRYQTVEDIKNELSPKKQLYIYYIINQNILAPNPHWNWGEGLNLGIYTNFGEARSIFQEKRIFQFFRSHFRENYDKVLWIQRDLRLGTQKIQKLLDWSKS
jgi:uncharacterized protein with ParB-like and HNH nuclease domain